MSVKIKYIPNILIAEDRKEIILPYHRDRSLLDFLKKSGFEYEGMRVIVLGKKLDNLNILLDNDDEIIITPDIKFDPATWAVIVTAFHIITAVVAVASIVYSIYQAVTYKKPSQPNFNTNGDGLDESSPTYGWDGIQTTQDVGRPIPIIYGEHKAGGNIINSFVRTDGDKNYLNVLIGLCEGEIESISNIKINDQPAANFDGVTTYQRLGANSQSVIANFQDLHNLYSLAQNLLQNNPYNYTTINNDVEGFELHFNLPNGLYEQDQSSGALMTWTVTYRVEYKLHSDSTYIDLGLTTISANSHTTVRRIYRKDGLVKGLYDIRITRTSEDSSTYKTGDLQLSNIDEIKTDDLAYPNTALLGIEAMATDQLSGAMPQFSCIVKGKKVRIPKIMNGVNEVNWNDYYWDSATSQYKLLSNGTVLSWDGTTYVERYSANPIWCVRDLQINTRYGTGEFIDLTSLDDTLLLSMSRYCEEKIPDGLGGYEKRFRMDIVLDSPARALDVLSQLASIFRGMFFFSEGTVKVKIDKPESPVQLFGMGNIIEGSFTQQWKSIKETPNVIEVQYLDKDKDYQQEQIAVIDEAALTAGDPIRKKQIKVFTTKMSYAIREGRYHLKVNKYIERSVSFKAGIDAIACQAGDRIDISHDVPQWGFSGRVQSGSTTIKVKLDQSVTIDAGKTYKIRVKFSDDTIEERTVSDPAGTYTEVIVSSAFSQAPQAYDVYALGESNKIIKPFRIVSMKINNNNEVEVLAIEYDENIYDDSAVTIPTNNYSALITTLPNVTNAKLTERIVKLPDGTIEDVIDAWFDKPVMTAYQMKKYAKAKIYLSDDNGVSWIYRGETFGIYLSLQGGIIERQAYKVAIVSVSSEGYENAIANSPQINIITQGKTAPPSAVTGFDIFQESNMLRFRCNPPPDWDFAYFRIKKGAEWSTGQLIAERADLTEFMYPVGEIGTVTFMIKIIDTSGNESIAATSDIITVTAPPEMNFIQNFDLWSRPFDYKLSADLAYEYRNLFNSNYVRKVLALKTATTWEEREAEVQTWEYQEANSGLLLDDTYVTSEETFEMPLPIDLGTIFEFKVIVDADYLNVANGSLAVQISHSDDGAAYTAWADVSASVLYRAQYVKYRFKLQTTNASYNIWFYGCTIYMNAPVTKIAWGRDIAIPVGGKTILFGAGFTYPPRVSVTVVNGVVGFPVVANKTKDQCDIKVYDAAGSAIGTAEIDFDARGY